MAEAGLSIKRSDGAHIAELGRTTHRPDIDGLRALAILPVVAFHLGGLGVHGGFVGVDIFFVISGYLIAGQLLGDIERGSFSIARFYERRVRRIAPALLVMLAVVSVACCFVMLPSELWRYGRSVISALLSVSNFYFWAHTGYFDGAAPTKPLLHTWSLAVEEQFYLLFPVLLYVLSRIGRRWRDGAIVGLALLSFSVSVYDSIYYPDAAFYFSHSRAWELLIGVALAVGIVRCPDSPALRAAMVAAGIALVCASVFFISANVPFPGVAALAPCGGSALIILGGMRGETWPGKLLSARPLVFIGLISYSLYLWHWPLIVFEKTWHVLPLAGWNYRLPQLALLVLSIVLATVSWRWVETPFRNRKRIPARSAFAATAGLAAVCAAIAALYIGTAGLPSRYPPNVAALSESLYYDTTPLFQDGRCFLSAYYTYADFDAAHCLKNDGRKSILLVGDSHVADLWYGLSHTLPGANVMLAAASGCKPIIPFKGALRCEQLMRHMFADVLPRKHFDLVIVSARWAAKDLEGIGASLKIWRSLPQRVVVIGPSPEYETDLPRLLIASQLSPGSVQPDDYLIPDVARTDEAMQHLVSENRLEYLSINRLLCAPKCQETVGSSPFVFDYGHFTAEGSMVAAKRIEAAISIPH